MVKSFIFLLVGLLSISACSADNETSPPMAPQWQLGKHYFEINPAQPTASSDKIEIIEVFSYACPHCAHFQPYADQLKASLPKNVTFRYLPAIFHPDWEPFARAYFTAQSLGLVENTHQALFDAIHRDRKPLHTIEELAGFYANYGIKPDTFLSTARSMVVEAELSRSMEQTRNYQIEGTPTLVVNGKYRVAGNSEAGIGYPEMLLIVNKLVKQELLKAKEK